ncbi:MAG: OB-fold domain-containing protein [Rhodoferax sp.]|jgi:uncharacterized OB-fold protein|nr:OB-fold domain-containing protein [Rhodoferax sp.]
MALAKRPPPELFKLSTNTWTQPFWDAAARHALVVARCGDCGHFRMPPTPFCPCCQSQRIDWTPLDGRGTVYAYTIVERAIFAGMEAHLPYVPAVISLHGAGEARLISNVVDVEVAQIHVGMPVQVVWDDVPGQGVAVPRFQPAEV